MEETPIDGKTIEHIAELAMISLTEEEKLRYQKQIPSILAYVKKIAEVETAEDSYYKQTDNENIMFDDVVEPSLSQEQVMSNREASSDRGYISLVGVFEASEG
ncbi:MAG: Asp-tRNA(Asn)/Glu-tRNA(Gln) amidotransferase subunit GatC [Candidatus Dojkabacteria bacterium]|nr:MAG: Asp-tRNA(Asn)/Glu-tRNA(Gln) amidotransferase subunit GatC [Candidatus Dojkabacteria bacterium]